MRWPFYFGVIFVTYRHGCEMFDQRLDYLHYNPVESGAIAPIWSKFSEA